MMENIIEIYNLTKKYGNLIAANDISFNVERGALFAFLGPNGAGKSTTINTICTTLEKTSGQIFVGGYEIGKQDNEIRNIIGVVYQESILDKLMTVKENLQIRSTFYNMTTKDFNKRLDEIADIVGIKEILDRMYGTLSGGERRRADIARGLIHKPQILFLDEPTTGLDPQTRIKVWDTIKQLQKENNMTIFFSTHYMEEASIADKVVIIDKGKIVANDTPNQLRLKYSNDKLRLYSRNMDLLLKDLNYQYDIYNDVIEIKVDNSKTALKILKQYEDQIDSFEFVHGNMDDVFVNLTGREIR